MRKKSTRLLSAALAVCMMLSALPVGAFAAEPGAEEQENGASAQADPVGSEFVEINDTNFPDPVFQQYVKDNIDTADTTSGQKDGKLSQAERDAVTEISITNTNCTDLTGIAYFANLKILYCSDNKLTGLDMSGNPALEQLLCYENNLESLNVTKNKKLSKLKCQHNGLKELNLKDNENLTELNCSYNQLTTLDVSKNAKLSILECYNNGMEELNLGDITNLSWLLCAENNLTELDVSKNPYLERLHCRHNKLRRLVIGKNYSLTMLYLMDNQLTSLDLNGKWEIWNFDYAVQSYAIDVNEDGTFDLTSLPEGFDASKTAEWKGGTRVGNTLNVNSHEVRYEYNTGSNYYRQKWMEVKLKVNGHKYQWQHDDTKHWRTCALEGCSGLTDAQEAKAPHDYTDATDPYCDTCGYVRSMHSVITGENVTAELEDKVLNVPVAADTKVHLTATVPEGQHFTGWTVKVNGVEQDPTFLKPDADDPTKVTFTMPDANVEVTATFADDPIPEPDPVGPSDTGNIQGAISAVVVGAAAGAIIYEAGTGIYRVINMPGIPMPSNRIELAELLWEHAGKPEPVSTALYSDIDEGDTDAQKAARWAVEQDLMKDDADNNKFHPAFPVSKLRTCLTWNAAKEKGLFDKTEE